jgi:hypothetical protein
MQRSALALALALGTGSVALPALAQDAMSASSSAAERTAAITRATAFVTGDAKATGTGRIVTENGRSYVELSKDFTLGDAPAPVVTLYKAATPPKKGYEASKYISLAALKRFKGAQRYELPKGTNPADYESIAIWCKKFDVTLAYAPIAR